MAVPCVACGTQPVREMRFCAQCGAQFPDTATNTRPPKKPHRPKPKKMPKAKQSKDDDTSTDTPAGATPAEKPVKVKLVVPPAATGDEASAIYKRLLAAVRGANQSNDAVVTAFKHDCKRYGQSDLAVDVFVDRLASYFGSALMLEHMLLELVRLLPDDRKRKQLVKAHAKRRSGTGSNATKAKKRAASTAVVTSTSETNPLLQHRQQLLLSSSTTDQPQQRRPRGDSDSSTSTSSTNSTSLILNQPHAAATVCAICSEAFELTRRRHRCRKCGASVCHSCSPATMLLSPDDALQATATKRFDPAHPQRVCTICAPVLQSLQRGLSAQFAACHRDNPHDVTTSRKLHAPWSRSLATACRNAADTLSAFFLPSVDSSLSAGPHAAHAIPASLLQRACGLAFVTIVKAGLFITARVGTGVVVAKVGENKWSAPSAIGTAGIGGGFEAGGEIVECVLLLMSPTAVNVFYRTQVNVGGALSVAVGPFGREAVAQAVASRSGMDANWSYSHSRGLFVGVSLHGAILTTRADVNRNFYGEQLTPAAILSGDVPPPRAAQCLYDAIARAMTYKES